MNMLKLIADAEGEQCNLFLDCGLLLKQVNLKRMNVEQIENYQEDICKKNKGEDCYLI